jgi:GTP-binding protein HflX
VDALDRVYRRQVPTDQVVTAELAETLAEISRAIRRQVGVLIDRRGRIVHVICGEGHRLLLPELGRHRAGRARLRGLRLVHTHLFGESLSRDDLTDLSLLHLDLVAVIQSDGSGRAESIEMAHLVPPTPAGALWELLGPQPIHGLDFDFGAFIADLEGQLAAFHRTRTADVDATLAVAVHVTTGAPGEVKPEASLAELRELAETAGVTIVETIVQRRRKPDPRFVIGRGKLEELVLASMQQGADLILFDRDLTPAQVRSIGDATEAKVIDRTQLILDIFARRASTRDGKLQVELAQLKYILPRLAGRSSAMSRLAGGIGGRGPGETKLEVDRRRAKDRLAHLQKQVKKLASQRQGRRQRRLAGGVPTAAIVGYTNAGKSTLLNALTGASVLTEDKLFATLDPTTRRLRFPDERELVLTDTVGFIRDLPRDLVAAFKATLEELEEADLLLHVVDVSNPAFEEQIDAVDKILDELELQAVERLVVLNKVDAAPADLDIEAISRRFGAVAISALDRKSLRPLTERLIAGIAPSERGWRWDVAP